jgi:thiol-disulfide isomerase/thioredoxin
MKKIIGFSLIVSTFLVLVSFQSAEDTVPYFSTKLLPYSPGDLRMGKSSIEKRETYAKLETGNSDFLENMYIGTGKQGENTLYWAYLKIKGGYGSISAVFQMPKDPSSNMFRDTLRFEFENKSKMIALEFIHDLSTNEIQYIWLDGDNNRSKDLTIITVDNPLQQGKMFPELTVEKLNGEKLSFGDLKGKFVVINWWATTCAPCIAEMPGFNKLEEKYRDNPNVVFVAVTDDDKERLNSFFQKKQFNYVQTIGDKDVAKVFGPGYPVHVIIAPTGKICFYAHGGGLNMSAKIEGVLSAFVE